MFHPFQKEKDTSESTKVAEFTIDGMHCVSCALNIDGALEDIAGVISSTTNYAQSKTRVIYDETKVKTDVLQKTIQAEGYGAHAQ